MEKLDETKFSDEKFIDDEEVARDNKMGTLPVKKLIVSIYSKICYNILP